MVRAAQTMCESLHDVEARQRIASVALRAAKLERRVYEKLEERFLRSERRRRERSERHECEEANVATRTVGRRAL
jgi:hypothetical protein